MTIYILSGVNYPLPPIEPDCLMGMDRLSKAGLFFINSKVNKSITLTKEP